MPVYQAPAGFGLCEIAGHNFVLKRQKHRDSGRICVKAKEDLLAGIERKRLAQDWQIAQERITMCQVTHSSFMTVGALPPKGFM